MTAKTENKNRVRPATQVYCKFVSAIEARRVELSLPMSQVDDLSGVQDGFFAKLVRPDAPNGRQSRWETLELVVQALFGTDYVIEIKPSNHVPPKPRPTRSPSPVGDPNRLHWRHQRLLNELFSELGRRGGEARAKIGTEKLSAIGRKGAKSRWRKAQRARRQAEMHDRELNALDA